MVLPAHEARFVMAPSRLTHCSSRGHRPKEREKAAHAQERDRGEDKPAPGSVPDEIDNRSDTRQSRRSRQNLSGDVVPQGGEHVGHRVLTSRVPSLKELHRCKERQKEESCEDRTKRSLACGPVKRCLQDEVRRKDRHQLGDNDLVNEVLEYRFHAGQPTRTHRSARGRYVDALRGNPRQQLRKCQKNNGPKNPLASAAVVVKVNPTFMPQVYSRGCQRAEGRRHREIEQQLEKVEEELWRLHRSPSSATECPVLE